MNAAPRIGLFGGTFDPIHAAHLAVADAAHNELNLDHLIFIPSGAPPHKQGLPRTSAAHRFSMAKLAITGESRYSVSDIELRRSGPSYTVDTVREIARDLDPKAQLFFIFGDDSAAQLHRWKGLDELLQSVTFVSAARCGQAVDASIAARISHLQFPPRQLSSTTIRSALGAGTPIDSELPAAVLQYVRVHGLYQNGSALT